MLGVADALPRVVARPQGCVAPRVLVTWVREWHAVQVVILHQVPGQGTLAAQQRLSIANSSGIGNFSTKLPLPATQDSRHQEYGAGACRHARAAGHTGPRVAVDVRMMCTVPTWKQAIHYTSKGHAGQLQLAVSLQCYHERCFAHFYATHRSAYVRHVMVSVCSCCQNMCVQQMCIKVKA